MAEVLQYTPPPTIKEFIKDYRPGELFYDWIVGPVGSGKTTGIFFKLVYMAGKQAKGPDGIRRSRAVVVRNTMPQLRDTTLSSWAYWFKDGQAGTWEATKNKFTLRFGDVECEVLFRALDTADDVARVLSLEVTFAVLDEFVQIPQAIVDALSARLGRYPSAKDGGATNWGMWGSSNPDTEDNWWFEYLHSNLPDNAHYFLQPSGLSLGAENVENLPGKAAYYTNQAKGKSNAWIKQFLEAEWGYSIAGKPVIATFKDMHISHERLKYNPHLPLAIGLDPGMGGSALIFGQEDSHGRLLVLGELVQADFGAERLINERLLPYIARHFPNAKPIIAPDPAAANRAQTDEKSVVDVFRRKFAIKIETNNQLPIRLDAIERYTTRLTELGPALLIDKQMCPILIRALKGGWKYILDNKRGDIIKGISPEKNQYSHPGDAFGYLARYFHRAYDRDTKFKGSNGKSSALPRPTPPNYHIR